VKDLRSILRLTYEQGLSVRAISERLQISKTSVATYLLRAREAGLSWPLPPIYESETALQRALFRRVGRPPQDLNEPDWPRVAQELKRKGVQLAELRRPGTLPPGSASSAAVSGARRALWCKRGRERNGAWVRYRSDPRSHRGKIVQTDRKLQRALATP